MPSLIKDSFKVIILSIVTSLSVYSVLAQVSWVEPSIAPPGGNISTPLNVGSTGQSKSGGLILNTGGATNGLIVSSGNVGIGTTSPTAKLHIGGVAGVDGIRFPDGTLQTTAGIPSGAVMFFNLTSCPSGWAELTAARGRYLVGLNSGGTLAGTDGTALSNLEDRPTGQHRHAYEMYGFPGNADFGQVVYGKGTGLSYSYDYGNTGPAALYFILPPTPAQEVAGTNAPYIQLLTCQKN